jgi:hypothetical protein
MLTVGSCGLLPMPRKSLRKSVIITNIWEVVYLDPVFPGPEREGDLASREAGIYVSAGIELGRVW